MQEDSAECSLRHQSRFRFYDLERSTLSTVPLPPEFAEWCGRFSKYEKAGASRFFAFLSLRGRSIGDVTDNDAEAFLTALDAEFPEKVARAKHKIALRTWNRLSASYADWPGRQLTRRLDGEAWALSWERFAPSLKMGVDALFAARQAPRDLFEQQPSGNSLKPTTVRNRLEHLRISASILCTQHGLQPGDLKCLADLCRPDRFKAVIGTVVERYEGKVTAYAEQIAITLLQAAQECGALSDAEVAEVKALKHCVYRRGLSDRKNDIGADQQILDELDDSARMDALLSLATKTVMRVKRRGKADRVAALAIQMALALEMWLAAPLRNRNYVMLRLDEHIHRVTGGGRKARFIIRVPGTETKNGKPLEHYLHDAAADLLELYLTVYRPLLAGRASPWLFPGRNNGHKRAAVFARQIKAYIWEGAGIRFHPHLIRKIVTKIILDSDPAAIEIARIILGHQDTRTTRAAYAQAQVRSAQTIYIDAMERRRLAAIGPLQPAAQRASAPAALRVGKGPGAKRGPDQ